LNRSTKNSRLGADFIAFPEVLGLFLISIPAPDLAQQGQRESLQDSQSALRTLGMGVIHKCNDFFRGSVRGEQLIAGLLSKLRYFEASILRAGDAAMPQHFPIGINFEYVVLTVHGNPSGFIFCMQQSAAL
jgi:hypothetical protein